MLPRRKTCLMGVGQHVSLGPCQRLLTVKPEGSSGTDPFSDTAVSDTVSPFLGVPLCCWSCAQMHRFVTVMKSSLPALPFSRLCF